MATFYVQNFGVFGVGLCEGFSSVQTVVVVTGDHKQMRKGPASKSPIAGISRAQELHVERWHS